MNLFLFLAAVSFLPLCFTGCINNKAYGNNCQFICTNCSLGCDISGTCINGACILGFYGRGCQEKNFALPSVPVLTASNCSVNVLSLLSSTTNIVNPVTYYVVFGPYTSVQSLDYTQWPSKTQMSCNSSHCQANVSIQSGQYIFGVYFDFYDINYSDQIQSLVSSVATATCNNVSLPTSKESTSTRSTTTTKPLTSTLQTPSTKIPSSSTTAINTIKKTTANPSSVNGSPKSLLSNISVHNLTWSSKSFDHIYISWLPPNITGQINYKVIVQDSNTIVRELFTDNVFQNITELHPGKKYTITINTINANSLSTMDSIVVCTNPSPDITIGNVEVQNVERKSLDVQFPEDRTNYTCSKNIYRVAVIETRSLNRRKRAASPTSSIPRGAMIIWNSADLPGTVALDNLNSATNYTIFAEIFTKVNGTSMYYYSITEQQTNGPTDGAIVAIVLGILLFLLLVVILIVLLCLYNKRKQRRNKHKYQDDITLPTKKPVDENKPRSFAYWSVVNDKMEPRQLNLNPDEWSDDLLKMETMTFNNQNYTPDGIRFIDEYNSLPDDSPYSYIDSQTHHAKNKRQDIFPYDHNRVKLRRTSVTSQSDYINASFIDGYLRKKAYIASQSPFDEETTNDFWKMVYEQNVGQIIMLTEVDDGNLTKSSLYWPQLHSKYVPKEIMYGTISVKMINEIKFAYYDIREFEIKDVCCTVESQLVIQYHFHGWSHNEIPENSIAFLDFYQTIKSEADISNGPLLVHCGTGVSQSAVFIAFDILNQQVIHENCINVFRTVAQLRRSRPKMLHNSKQYMFLYDILFESLLCGQFIVNSDVKKIYKLLHKVNPQSRIEYIHEQFYLLQTYHYITTSQKTSTDGLITMDSIDCCQNLSSIASPTVIVDKIDDFWHAIFNNKIEVVVDLRTTDDKPYYIRDNLQSFDLAINEISKINECFRKFDISLYDLRHEKRQNVVIYQFGVAWVNGEDVKSEPNQGECTVMVELMHHLIMNHSRDRILSHCVNGWSKSGLFLTCFNMALKMYRSKYVMVYNVVKSMKFYRFEFVTSYAQYRFIYNFLKKWVDMKMPVESRDEECLSGLLPSGDKLKESLFTHEQTPVLRPEQKLKYAPSLKSYGSGSHSLQDNESQENMIVVHYNVGTFQDIHL